MTIRNGRFGKRYNRAKVSIRKARPSIDAHQALKQGPQKAISKWLNRPVNFKLPDGVALLVVRVGNDTQTTPIMYERASANSGRITHFIDPESPLYPLKHYMIGDVLDFK